MQRNVLIVGLAAGLVLACEQPTGPIVHGDVAADVAPSTTPSVFSGEATVVQATVTPLGVTTPITIDLVDTGKLPESGGALNSTLIELGVPEQQTAGLVSLDARVGHAHTVGQGTRSSAQATVADLDLNVAGNAVQATFLEAVAQAVCAAAGSALVTGRSAIAGLVINNTAYTVGTAPNQVIVDQPALRVVANEQDPQSSGADYGAITVNALRVTAYALNLNGTRGAELADVVVASAHADIRCGRCTDQGDDFTTGGGWITDGQARKNFAVAGGYKQGAPWGHLTYHDKAANLKVKGKAVLSYVNSQTERGNTAVIEGEGELADGTPVTYTETVSDNGEAGAADEFRITLSTGYAAGGVLGGGNIQFHDRPSRCPE